LRFNAVVVADEHGNEVTSVRTVEVLLKGLR
jgi:hypothetical protein